MDKLTLAHDWAMKHGDKCYPNLAAEQAWEYADAMFEESEKRKDKTLPDSLWQPDWSLAPDDAVAFAVDKDTEGQFFTKIPVKMADFWGGVVCERYTTNHNYTGDWRDSLRIRPQK